MKQRFVIIQSHVFSAEDNIYPLQRVHKYYNETSNTFGPLPTATWYHDYPENMLNKIKEPGVYRIEKIFINQKS